MIDFVYVPIVKLLNNNKAVKSIEKRRVLKYTNKYVTVDDYGTGVRLPVEQCFVDGVKAKEACEKMAEELIEKLKARIDELLVDAEVPTEVKGVFYPPDKLEL